MPSWQGFWRWVHCRIYRPGFGGPANCFYTARQITLTFLGEPRTHAAEHAHESRRVMTVPLIILAVFAVGVGWAGIPATFPGLGGLIPDWFNNFLNSMLPAGPAAEAASLVPLFTSLVVSLGGLLLGWSVYRNQTVGKKTRCSSRWAGCTPCSRISTTSTNFTPGLL